MFKFGKYGKSLGDLNFISFLSLFFFLIFALISIPNSLDAQSDTCYVKKIYKSKQAILMISIKI